MHLQPGRLLTQWNERQAKVRKSHVTRSALHINLHTSHVTRCLQRTSAPPAASCSCGKVRLKTGRCAQTADITMIIGKSISSRSRSSSSSSSLGLLTMSIASWNGALVWASPPLPPCAVTLCKCCRQLRGWVQVGVVGVVGLKLLGL